jgi:hypothetical protein
METLDSIARYRIGQFTAADRIKTRSPRRATVRQPFEQSESKALLANEECPNWDQGDRPAAEHRAASSLRNAGAGDYSWNPLGPTLDRHAERIRTMGT